jgi:hypothetical protein
MLALHALHAIMHLVCSTPLNRRKHEHEACNVQHQLALIAWLHHMLPNHYPKVPSSTCSMSHTSWTGLLLATIIIALTIIALTITAATVIATTVIALTIIAATVIAAIVIVATAIASTIIATTFVAPPVLGM